MSTYSNGSVSQIKPSRKDSGICEREKVMEKDRKLFYQDQAKKIATQSEEGNQATQEKGHQ